MCCWLIGNSTEPSYSVNSRPLGFFSGTRMLPACRVRVLLRNLLKLNDGEEHSPVPEYCWFIWLRRHVLGRLLNGTRKELCCQPGSRLSPLTLSELGIKGERSLSRI